MICTKGTQSQTVWLGSWLNECMDKNYSSISIELWNIPVEQLKVFNTFKYIDYQIKVGVAQGKLIRILLLLDGLKLICNSHFDYSIVNVPLNIENT